MSKENGEMVENEKGNRRNGRRENWKWKKLKIVQKKNYKKRFNSEVNISGRRGGETKREQDKERNRKWNGRDNDGYTKKRGR